MDLSNYSITQLAEMALKKPEDFGYWGNKDMFITWGFTGHDESAMSKILEQANFKAITNDLLKEFPEDFYIEQYSHWVCGWVRRLTCRILKNERAGIVESNITDAFKKSVEIHNHLEDYPIYDEYLYMDMETDEILSTISDLPSYLKEYIDEDDFDWLNKVISKLYDNDVVICPDTDDWPTDDQILKAVYDAKCWNQENIEIWEDVCDRLDLEFPPKNNTNQLNLFGE